MKKILNCGMKFLLMLFVGMAATSCSKTDDTDVLPEPQTDPVVEQEGSFIKNDKVWVFTSYSTGNPQPIEYITEARYRFSGDTLIGKPYKKLYVSYRHFASSDETPLKYEGAAREVGSKVFMIKPGETQEELLYDFGMEIGRQYPVTTNGDDIVNVAVESEDYFLIDDSYVRSMTLAVCPSGSNKTYNVKWIAGIGVLNGGLTGAFTEIGPGAMRLAYCEVRGKIVYGNYYDPIEDKRD